MNKALFREFAEASSSLWTGKLGLLFRHDLYFENRLADTAELVELAHQVRYQVYVLERKFFDSADHHASGLEVDEYDSHSIHGILFHRPTGEAMGTVRLIRP